MKRTMIAMFIVVAILGCYAIAEADVFDATVPLTLTVPEQWGFVLTAYSWDFGTISPAGGAETTLGIFCSSNHNRVWHMALNANAFSNGLDVIPSDPGFIFAAWTDASDPIGGAQGTFHFPTGGPVPVAQTDFYTSTLGEGADPFTALTLGLYVTVPAGQPSGLYSTDLILTMHD